MSALVAWHPLSVRCYSNALYLVFVASMADPFPQHIVPIPQANAEEILILNQIAYEFRDEVKHRQSLEQYSQWYQQTAKQNRRDLAVMRQEFNLFRWLGVMRKRP
jgi:hypothetical protein